MKEAAKEAMRVEPKISEFTVTCKMVRKMNHRIKTVIFRPRRFEKAYEINKYADISEIDRAAEIYAHIILKASGRE